jgi:hypothetical protein
VLFDGAFLYLDLDMIEGHHFDPTRASLLWKRLAFALVIRGGVRHD